MVDANSRHSGGSHRADYTNDIVMNDVDWEDDDSSVDDWDEGAWDYDVGGDDSESDVVPCPACGADIYEDAEQCPVCREYITHDTSTWSTRPTWWILLGIAGIIAVIIALLP